MKHITPRRVALIAALLFIAFFALMPLRFAFGMSGLEERGVSARSVEGIIWSGTVRDMKIGALPLGDVGARLKLFPLLTGTSVMVIDREPTGFSPALHAVIGSRGDLLTIDDATGDIATRDLFAPVPVSTITLENVTGEFDAGTCVSASGTMRVTVQQSILGQQLSRGLSGKIACRKGALFIPLVGQSGFEKLDITITARGRYDAVFTLGGLTPEITGPLGLLGFSGSGDSVQLKSSGQF